MLPACRRRGGDGLEQATEARSFVEPPKMVGTMSKMEQRQVSGCDRLIVKSSGVSNDGFCNRAGTVSWERMPLWQLG
jgi:hypothetical protein